jgi:multidrug efflux system outer membrane protein
MKKIIFTSVILLAILSSCMVGKKYSRPEMAAPNKWEAQNKYINTPDSVSNLKWFNVFNDSVLNSLIDTALMYNYDLASAAARIEQARAVYGIAKADLLPSVGYSAGASLNSHTSNDFNVVATASWEIDFFGKLRHAKKAAYAEILASEEGLKTVTTTLISDVSTYYFLMRDLDNRLAIAQRSVETRTEYFNLVNARFKGGDVSELDMLQADQQLQVAIATVNITKRQLNSTERSLNILLGQTPQSIVRGIDNADQQVVDVIPAGLPSSLLEQRPDVRQAEYYLEAETERIGVTQAMRFPSVSLTGFLGLASADLSTLLTGDALVANAAAGILGPIFNFGANKRRVEIQKKQAELAANNYYATWISALGEVESALVSIETYAGEYDARKKQAESASRWLMLSQERYNSGYTDYLEVLIAENAMLDSKLQASATRAQQLSSYIYLYRALGGGW